MLSKALWTGFIAAKGLKPRWREMDAFASLSPQQARLDLAKRLQAQIQYFGSREDALPEWRSAARIQDPLEVWGRWPELPIVTKDMLRTQFNAHNLKARLKVHGVVASTGGSTGEPVWYFHDTPALESRGVTGLYSRMRMGWHPGMPTICVWGSERDIGQQRSLRGRVSGFLRNEHLVDGYGLGFHTVETVMGLIGRHRPVALYGFTSMLEFLARQVLAARIDVLEGSIAVAWNGGEMLFDTQAELFRQAFKTPIHNLYGGRELGAIAHQVDPNGPMFVLRPHVFLEIVDRNGAPAAPGESGRIVCTSTVCRGTPFLRYEVGDAASYSAGHHDESGIRAISEIQGRIAGLLQLPNGKVINCLYWNHLLKGFSEIHQFQVVLRRTGSIDLLLKGDGLSAQREVHLQGVFQNFLGDVPVHLNWVERIPLTPQGKLVQVVREDPNSEPKILNEFETT
jgi:phenylacetate-CoA ligase